jgi:acyl phosphate:glycerol-3-phosphate acyltransferase
MWCKTLRRNLLNRAWPVQFQLNVCAKNYSRTKTISLTLSVTMNSSEIAGGIIAAVTAYLLGSLPTGYLVARAKGIDIRTVGSGNIGATNAFRVLGKAAGTIVLLADGLKGFAACAWLADFFIRQFSIPPSNQECLKILAGVAAVLGHNYTCWLKFKGGKGIATTAGIFFALAPLAAGVALAVWIFVLAVSRYASLASIAGAIALPATVWLTKNNLTLQLVTTALGLLAIFKHKENIKRLLAGTERRFGEKKLETTK